MSTNQFTTNWLRYLEALNQRDVNLMDRLTDECMTTDAIFHMPGWPDMGSGSAAQKKFASELIVNNPNFHISVDDVLFDEGKMILRCTIQLNNPTTGAVESYSVLEIDHVVDGKIAEGWTLAVPGIW